MTCAPCSQALASAASRPGDASEDGHSRQAVQGKSTGRFSAAIESGYDLALQVDDLEFAVDPETREHLAWINRGL